MMDKRNLENSMPYFPTEQEWLQMVRPSRIDMDERFPGKYAVNSLPLYGAEVQQYICSYQAHQLLSLTLSNYSSISGNCTGISTANQRSLYTFETV
jgi:hypothetical protein